MRPTTLFLALLVISILALGAIPALADVHPVAQAACAPTGVASGAIGSRQAIGDPGRPAAPIMITASPWERSNFPGILNSKADPQGTNC